MRWFGRKKAIQVRAQSVRAKLIGIHATDIPDLENWLPGSHFGVHVMIFVGPADDVGEESFYATVCSPSWFAERLESDEIRSGYQTIFMKEYDYRKLHSFVERAVHRVEAPTWRQLAEKLDWLGYWEFSDYQSYKG